MTASTSPRRMAESVASASSSRAESSTTRRRSAAALAPFPLRPSVVPLADMRLALCLVRPDTETDQDLLLVRHVADELAQRKREFLDQRRGGDDLLAPPEGLLLVDVDHFEVVLAWQILLADAFEVRYGPDGAGAHSRD